MRPAFLLLLLYVTDLSAQVVLSGPIMRTIPAAGGPSYLLEERFEGTGTPSGWTTSGTGTVNYDYASTPAPLAGSESMQLNRSSGTYQVISPSFTAQDDIWVFFRCSPEGNDSSSGTFTFSQMADVALRVNGSHEIILVHGTVEATSSGVTATQDAHFRIWMHLVTDPVGGGADGVATVYISSSSDTRPVSPVISLTSGNGSTQFSNWTGQASTSTHLNPWVFDDVVVSTSEITDAP